MKMEMTDIKANRVPPSDPEWTSDRVRKFEEPDERSKKNVRTKGPSEGNARGDSQALKSVSEKTLNDIATRVNQVAESMQYQIQFIVERKSRGVVVKVLDNDGKLIRQIPPEDIAAISSDPDKNSGLLLNTEM
jgi:uncharacterized FlaG/YvyC family protein